MKKLVYGIVALAFVFTLSFTLNAQTDGTEKAPQAQTQKVEKKKECKATCDKTAKKECTAETKAACDKTAKKECTKSAEKACCKKAAELKK